MRTIVEIEDIVVRPVPSPQITPPSGDESANPCDTEGLNNQVRQSFWIFNDNAPETNVYGVRTVIEEGPEIRRWLVYRRFSKEEPADV